MSNHKDLQPITTNHLTGQALIAFNRIVPLIDNIRESDVPALELLASTYAEWLVADKDVATKGEIIKSPNGALQLNPYYKIRKDASNRLAKMYTEFLLTPSARKKLERSTEAQTPEELEC